MLPSINMARRRAILCTTAGAALHCWLSHSAWAQSEWPSRPVRFIVPTAAGGGVDAYARLIAQALTASLKQQVIVENIPGAGGNIGAAALMRQAADGYTFMLSADQPLTINNALYKDLPYDAARDFEPVAAGVNVGLVLCVHPSAGVKSLAELLDVGKRHPDRLAYGSSGTASPNRLAITMLEEASGARFLHVPFKGVGVAFPALLGGQVQMLLSDVVLALPHLKSGKLVGVVINQKSALLPEVPTLAEAGHPQLSFPGSFGIVARVGTPATIVQRMNEEINSAMRSSAVAEKLEAAAFYPKFQTPAEYGTALQKAREYWAPFLKRHNISPE